MRAKHTAYQERLDDIREHPERHQHADLNELTRCCWDGDAVNLSLMEAHSKFAPVGYNGQPCDVQRGPCSCGAWH